MTKDLEVIHKNVEIQGGLDVLGPINNKGINRIVTKQAQTDASLTVVHGSIAALDDATLRANVLLSLSTIGVKLGKNGDYLPDRVTASAKNCDGTDYLGLYSILASDDGADWEEVYQSSEPESTASYAFSNCLYVRVRLFDPASPLLIKEQLVSIIPEISTDAPNNVLNINVEAYPGIMKIDWTAVDGATAYALERSTDGGEHFFIIGTINTNHFDEVIAPGIEVATLASYRYSVKAYSIYGFPSEAWTISGAPDTAQYGTYVPAAPMVGFNAQKRALGLFAIPQSNLINADGWDIQIGRDNATWYAPNLAAASDADGWYTGTAGGMFTNKNPNLEIGYLPIPLVSGLPQSAGQGYYLRVRARCSSPATTSAWTTSGLLTVTPTLSADIAAQQIAAANLGDNSVIAAKIYAGAVTAGKLGVTNLEVDADGSSLRWAAQTIYSRDQAAGLSTDPGARLINGSYRLSYFFLGSGIEATPKFRIGTASKYIYFDGADIYFKSVNLELNTSDLTTYSGTGPNRTRLRHTGSSLVWDTEQGSPNIWGGPTNSLTHSPAGIAASGALIASGAGGFASATVQANVRNPIWRFGNSDPYGLSYFHGSSGDSGGYDMIGVHFGSATAADSQFGFRSDGALRLHNLSGQTAYLMPNVVSSYGSLAVYGFRNGWTGIALVDAQIPPTFMSNGDSYGIYDTSYGWTILRTGGNVEIHAPALLVKTEAGAWSNLYASHLTAYGGLTIYPDNGGSTRNPNNFIPTTFPSAASFHFWATGYGNTPPGIGGNYYGGLTFCPWDGTAGSTGESSYQLAFYHGDGVNYLRNPRLAIRSGIDNTWGPWKNVNIDGRMTGNIDLSLGVMQLTVYDALSPYIPYDPAAVTQPKMLLHGGMTNAVFSWVERIDVATIRIHGQVLSGGNASWDAVYNNGALFASNGISASW